MVILNNTLCIKEINLLREKRENIKVTYNLILLGREIRFSLCSGYIKIIKRSETNPFGIQEIP